MPLATGRVLLARPCGFSPASRDDLQEVQRMLKAADLDVDLQFVNYR